MFAPANAAHFKLLIPSVPNDFKVLAFKGTEAISSLYEIQVELVSESPDFDLESLLSQPAFLQFGLNGEGIHGRIKDVFVGEAGKRMTRYHLALVPALQPQPTDLPAPNGATNHRPGTQQTWHPSRCVYLSCQHQP